jgi:hypothetical protein
MDTKEFKNTKTANSGLDSWTDLVLYKSKVQKITNICTSMPEKQNISLNYFLQTLNTTIWFQSSYSENDFLKYAFVIKTEIN